MLVGWVDWRRLPSWIIPGGGSIGVVHKEWPPKIWIDFHFPAMGKGVKYLTCHGYFEICSDHTKQDLADALLNKCNSKIARFIQNIVEGARRDKSFCVLNIPELLISK